MTVDYIKPRDIHVLDGGFGSLLEELGYNVDNHELWSGGANIDRLDLVRQAHEMFIEAGADIIMTNTYHVSIQKLRESRGLSLAQAEEVILKCVRIAKDAIRSSGNSSIKLVGSIGPYATYLRDGSEYTGSYTKVPNFDPQIIIEYYLTQAKPLVEAGIDCLVFETIPSLKEVECVGKVLDRITDSIQAWIVVSCQNGTKTRSGDNFKEVVRLATIMPKVTFVGINCTSPLHITELLESATSENVTIFDDNIKQMRHHKPYVIYPNSAEEYNTELKKFEGSPKIEMIAELIPRWYKLSARIFGGCCRVLPAHIQKIALACKTLSKDVENNN